MRTTTAMIALPDDSLLLRLLAGLLTLSVPGLGWLIKRSLSYNERMVKVETVQATHDKKFDELGGKIDGVAEKLDILPRLDETMRNLTRVCETIVPRPEWETVNRLQEARMDRIEHST
jgi:hypothetical protein